MIASLKFVKSKNSQQDDIHTLKLGRLVLMKDALELITAGKNWPITV